MPSCFVPGCKNGYGKDSYKGNHFFRPPRDEDQFAKWERAISRKDKRLAHKSYVCQVHFSDDLILKVDSFVVNNKKVEIARLRWTLKPGAVPNIFPNLLTYLTKPRNLRKSPARRHIQQVQTGQEKNMALSSTRTMGERKNSHRNRQTKNKTDLKKIKIEPGLSPYINTVIKEEVDIDDVSSITVEESTSLSDEDCPVKEEVTVVDEAEYGLCNFTREKPASSPYMNTVIKEEVDVDDVNRVTVKEGITWSVNSLTNKHLIAEEMHGRPSDGTTHMVPDILLQHTVTKKSDNDQNNVCDKFSSDGHRNATQNKLIDSTDVSSKLVDSHVLSYQCNLCNETFSCRLLLSQHMLIHGSKKKYQCSVCNKVFNHRGNFSQHTLIHRGKKPYTCNVCNKAFNQARNLSIHKVIHSGKKDYQCSICSKAFTHARNLAQHKLIHSGKKDYQCDVCNKTFYQRSNLSRHIVIHSDKKEYQCSICNKAFTHASNLSQHKLIHSGKKDYQCDVCNKTFYHRSNLSRHKVIHSDKKDYQCTVCTKEFKLSTTYLSQNMLIHSGKKPYTCDMCYKAFTLPLGLSLHKVILSGKKEYQCVICKKAFRRLSTLSQHTLIHIGKKDYQCSVCNKAFTQASTFSQHKLIHSGKKPYTCNVCNKAFTQASNLSQHKLIHTGKKDYQCDICNKTFNHRGNLSRHKLIHSDKKR